MNYNDLGFRPLYHSFAALEMSDNLIPLIKDFPSEDETTGLLVYGYIDHEAGFTFEVLAAGRIEENGSLTSPIEENTDIRAFIRVEEVADNELHSLEDSAEMISAIYENKIKMIESYNVSEEIEETRAMEFLDDYRHPAYIDDIYVCFFKKSLKAEGCWVRIEGMGEHEIIGVLLNEPDQDFGYHIGDTVAFNMMETEDGRVIPYVAVE